MAFELCENTLRPLSCLFDEIKSDLKENVNMFPSWYLPIMTLYFSMFFLIFDFCTNFYAELTGFGDR